MASPSRKQVWILLLAAVAALAQQQQQPQEPPKKAHLEGTVVSITGAPVPRAQVRLQSPTSIQNGAPAPGANYSATTDDAGKFAMDISEPGVNYSLTAQKTGFLPARYGARNANSPAALLAIEAGQTLKDLALTMTPQGVVAGRVTDPNGDPVQGAQVVLQRRGYQRGVRTLLTSGNAQTNDQGEYRIPNVPPGRYYLQVTGRRVDAAITSGPAEEIAPLPTYYPNGSDALTGAAITIEPGQELRGYDIRLRQGRVYSASGKVVGVTGQTILVVTPRMASGLDAQAAITQILAEQQTRPDGSFVLRGLTPGNFTVNVLAMQNGNSLRLNGTLDLTITDKNLTDLVFPLAAAAANITGAVRLEGGEIKDVLPAVDPNQNSQQAGVTVTGPRFAINLTSTAPSILSNRNTGPVNPDGAFVIEGAGPGTYYLSPVNLPNGTYVKSARFAGTDVTRGPLNVAGSGGTLDVVLAKNPASVTGTVQDEKGNPQSGLMVSLWSQEPDQSSAAGGVRTATTDRKGTFNFQGLRPGSYYVAAFEDVDSGLAQGRDFLVLLTTDATKVELKDGASQQLKMIPVAKSKAAEEKLP